MTAVMEMQSLGESINQKLINFTTAYSKLILNKPVQLKQ